MWIIALSALHTYSREYCCCIEWNYYTIDKNYASTFDWKGLSTGCG